jgi:hypothetical protein
VVFLFFGLFVYLKTVKNLLKPYCTSRPSLPDVFCEQSYMFLNKKRLVVAGLCIFVLVFVEFTCVISIFFIYFLIAYVLVY